MGGNAVVFPDGTGTDVAGGAVGVVGDGTGVGVFGFGIDDGVLGVVDVVDGAGTGVGTGVLGFEEGTGVGTGVLGFEEGTGTGAGAGVLGFEDGTGVGLRLGKGLVGLLGVCAIITDMMIMKHIVRIGFIKSKVYFFKIIMD